MSKDFFPPLVDQMWHKWTQIGVKPPSMTKLGLKNLYDWFMKMAEQYNIDPKTVDFEYLVDSTLTYDENQVELAEAIGIPKTLEIEEEPTSLKELLDRVGITLPGIDDPNYPFLIEDSLRELSSRLHEVEKRGNKVQVIGRDKQGRPRKIWMNKEKLVDMIGDLNRQGIEYAKRLEEKERELTEERRRREEAEKELREDTKRLREVTIKFKRDMSGFVGQNMKTYGPYKVGDIASLPEGNADVLIEKGLAEAWMLGKAPPKVEEPKPPKVQPTLLKKLSKEDVIYLHSLFNTKIYKAINKLPPVAKDFFNVEVEKLKDKTRDEAEKLIDEAVERFVSEEERKAAMKYMPTEEAKIPMREKRVEVYRPPSEPMGGEGEGEIIPWVKPAYPFPSTPLSKRRWPSRPTVEEADALWEHFAWRLAEKGLYPAHKLYHDAFEKFIAGTMFPSYSSILKIFDDLIKHIASGADINLFAIKLAPIYEMTMPWRPGEKMRYDAILFTVRWAASNNEVERWKPKPEILTMEDVIEELANYGIYADEAEVVEVAKQGWKERKTFIVLPDGGRMAHWLMFTSKNELEKLLNTTIE